LATAGTIAPILCHFRFVRINLVHGSGWMVAAMVCAFAAMGAKESGICVVPLILLGEGLGLFKHGAPGISRRILRTSYLLLPLVAYLALRFYALGGVLHQAPAPTKTVNVLVDAPVWQHALGVFQAWGMYWAKTIFPRELCIEYAINAVRLATSIWQFHVLLGLAWAATMAFVIVWGWRRGRKELAFVAVALVISYLPTSNAFVLIQIFFAERMWYLPSVFVAAMVGMAAYHLLDRRMWRIVGVSVLAVMVVRSWIRNSEWSNNGTLFAAAYADHPQSVMARHLYGQWLTQQGDFERGITLIQKALEIDQGFTDAQRSLGKAYLKLGRIGDALRHFQIAEMQVSGHSATRAALGEASAVLQVRFGTYLEEARRTALEHPSDPRAQLAYISMLRDLGLTHDAVGLLEEGRERFGDNPDWAAETAVTLVYLNRRDDAIDAYRRALELSQSNAQHMVELAMLLIERRRAEDVEEARRLAEAALILKPDDPHVHVARGEVQALQGDISKAKESFRRAVQLAHPGSDYARLLAERAKAIGQ
jgi:tetratricopeptide (TPR) repeat protein